MPANSQGRLGRHSLYLTMDGKFQLVGTVAGVTACQLISDKDEIIVGSGITCHLVIADPLVPRRAFRLKRKRHHVDPDAACDTHWVLETFSRARTYVNGNLVRRGHVEYGDTIALGCHQLRFEAAAHESRDRRTNTRVDDLCRRLMQNEPVPNGFLESCPSWLNRRRVHKAAGVALSVVSVLVILCFFAPRQERFEQVQMPMEVMMMAERSMTPDPGAVRSMALVERKSIVQPESQPPTAPSEILPSEAPAVAEMEFAPVDTAVSELVSKPAAPAFQRVAAIVPANLPTLQVPRGASGPPKIDGPVTKLQGTASTRRLSLREASDPVFRKELGDVQIKIAGSSATATPIQQWSGPITRSVEKPSAAKLESNRAEQLAALEHYKPSPLKFTQHQGAQIPIAHLPTDLAQLEVKQTAAGGIPTPGQGVVMDGEVSASEIAVSWKSGGFKLHRPGTPPEANPSTYCYVGKTEKAGRPFLYISFVCIDPNVDQLVLNHGSGSPTLCQDDGIEIYLDHDMNRTDYFQMIVNARGNWWTGAVLNKGGGAYDTGPSWDAQQELKTTINKQAGRWTCEILIPFDHLGGGVPAKGTRWAVNFCRNFRGQGAGDDDRLQTWFLVYDGTKNYHNPNLFGVFEW